MKNVSSSASSSALLVTGAAGFIGSQFVRSCNEKGIPVISVDAPACFGNRDEHRAIHFGTLVDREKLFPWLLATKPEVRGVVHLGACTDTTEMDVSLLNRLNLDFSKALWSYCAETSTPLVYASSAATYGDGKLGYSDDESLLPQLRPLNLYGESKQQFDLWALGEERRGFHPPTWAGFKFFNVYGFGERHKAKMASVVLHAFDQVRAGKSLRLFKSERADIAHGYQARDFVFVKDVVDVMWFALTPSLRRGIFNLGTGQARTYLDLARAVFSELERPEKIEFIDMPREVAPRYQYFTEARMEKLRAAGYSTAFTSLEAGVAKYIRELLTASLR